MMGTNKNQNVWHSPTEKPIYEEKEIIVEWEKYHDVGYYNKETNMVEFAHYRDMPMTMVKKWAYMEDILDRTNE